VKPTLDKLRSSGSFLDADDDKDDDDLVMDGEEGKQQGGPAAAAAAAGEAWQDAADRLSWQLKQQMLQDMAMQSAWQLGAAEQPDEDDIGEAAGTGGREASDHLLCSFLCRRGTGCSFNALTVCC
jgi:hypothetical protein